MWKPLVEILSAARPIRPDALHHPHFMQPHAVSLTIDEVESLWAPIAAQDDWQPLANKITAIRTMRAALDDVAITAIPQINGGPLLPD